MCVFVAGHRWISFRLIYRLYAKLHNLAGPSIIPKFELQDKIHGCSESVVLKYCDTLAKHKAKAAMLVIRDQRLVLRFTATGHI